ncbi:MAG TPA: tetratricopeptide repeat protein [Terriglobia bacterium]|nr:tetratricopeptide repeat protein [Terriglobia bacterium]
MRFLRYSIILVFALLCMALPSSAQLPSSAVHEAIADLNEQKFQDAEAILKDLLRDHPHDPTLLGFMAVALDGEKRYAEAETYFSQAIKLSPDSAPLLNNLGTHYLAIGDRERARRAYLSAWGSRTIGPKP